MAAKTDLAKDTTAQAAGSGQMASPLGRGFQDADEVLPTYHIEIGRAHV